MISKSQMLIFSSVSNIFISYSLHRLALTYLKCLSSTSLEIVATREKIDRVVFWKPGSLDSNGLQRLPKNLYSVVTSVCVYPHAKFQVIPVRNVKDIRDFLIWKFAVHNH